MNDASLWAILYIHNVFQCRNHWPSSLNFTSCTFLVIIFHKRIELTYIVILRQRYKSILFCCNIHCVIFLPTKTHDVPTQGFSNLSSDEKIYVGNWKKISLFLSISWKKTRVMRRQIGLFLSQCNQTIKQVIKKIYCKHLSSWVMIASFSSVQYFY